MPLGEIPAALSFCFTSFKHPTGSFSATTLKSRETSAGRPRPRLSSPSTTFHPSLLQTYPLSTDLVDLAFLLRLPVAMIQPMVCLPERLTCPRSPSSCRTSASFSRHRH